MSDYLVIIILGFSLSFNYRSHKMKYLQSVEQSSGNEMSNTGATTKMTGHTFCRTVSKRKGRQLLDNE